MKKWLVLLLSLTVSSPIFANVQNPFLVIGGNEGSSSSYAVSLQILAVMTALTLLPGLLLAMTSFTRIIIVMSILRQAIGMNQTPSNQILIGLSLFLTFFVMAPVFNEANLKAIQPYLAGKMDASAAVEAASIPLKQFMLNQTRERDLHTFLNLSDENQSKEIDKDNVSIAVLIPAFISSELKTAFQMGFVLFIPFLIIDLVVASVLMAMGMMMLSPLVISLPFKLMLFVLVDGWALIMGTLAGSFKI
jgi:flagellar biosynthetic protein FliP